MNSSTYRRRNALNTPGFYTGSDSYKRKRSLDYAAWNRGHNEKDHGDGVSLKQHGYSVGYYHLPPIHIE